jgi:hypothetical protein
LTDGEVGDGRVIDAVCPLVARDLDRFSRILVPSLQRHLPDLGTCWVVVPEGDVAAVEAAITDPRFRVVPELELVPELPKAIRLRFLRHPGWYVQQVVKLAAAERVGTPFFLTLDADVICMRPTSIDDLVVDGRGICQEYPVDFHPKWERWAKRVLRLPSVPRNFNVTPAVLATGAVAELVAHLERRMPWWRRLRGQSWRASLLGQLPWTEYRLYFNFLVATGRLDDYHHVVDEHVLHRDSVWKAGDWQAWSPSAEPSPSEPHFVVIQSTTRVPVDDVLARLGGRLDP